ncbi:glycosyltransferase family 1 protein [Gonapodya prolifera JEL478]|uniref:Glycosyltransferase family 1 protein n=1 Tax=Gonapodya prolifera (strain JEL478) TaxID=1344416 RepID=A0A139AV86_GONPJ|nr:glycosyltransferase family 1 protein [Gonapodya prolifera JEL478]|eukprot:KXS20638.1 glycosyltransferase family 1 protein [Gonapodya prolifera JEL478]
MTPLRVYVGTSPLRGYSGWLTYTASTIEKSIFNDARAVHSYVVIGWSEQGETKFIRYEWAMLDEGGFKTLVTPLAMYPDLPARGPAPEPVDHLFLTFWSRERPDDRVIEVGLTTRTPAEAERWTLDWIAQDNRYNAFWNNCRTFVDGLCEYMVTVRPAPWERPFPGTTKLGPFTAVGTAGKTFTSPLEYAHYCDKKSLRTRQILTAEAPTLPPRYRYSDEVGSEASVSSSSSVMPPNNGASIEVERASSEGRFDVIIEDSRIGEEEEDRESGDESIERPEPTANDVKQTIRKSKAAQKAERELREALYKAREPMVVPRLNVVITIVGSRGDVQPFIALGKQLQKPSPKHPWGHRVRLATHATFRKFVTDAGLEFYPLAGDPVELMAFMVKNPGLIPGVDSILAGDISRKRSSMADIIASVYRACTEADPADALERPFIADAIIANPPSFGHVHVAEKLGIPVHVFFTMPWTPTRVFPHPLANIKNSSASVSLTNKLSYDVMELLTWEGLGDLVNEFRHSLGLSGIAVQYAPFIARSLKIPHTYAWSPSLVPKPPDWKDYIDVVGFFHLPGSGELNYEPPADLLEFLSDSKKPVVYIGFGSIVIDDPDGLTTMIFEACQKAGVRALISKGWGGIGGSELHLPKDIYLIGSCPHDWLFQNVSAVVHHGGAGTTATGLKCGRPTCVVPFFGDQPFWGAMIANRGAGPPPIPFKKLTSDKLADAIKFCLRPDVQKIAEEIKDMMSSEDGVAEGVASFHKHLPLENMVCDIHRTQLARWFSEESCSKLSDHVALVLIEAGRISRGKLMPYLSTHWDLTETPHELLTGVLAGTKSFTVGAVRGVHHLILQSYRGMSKAAQAPSKTDGAIEIAKGVGVGIGSMGYHLFKGTGNLLLNSSGGMHNTVRQIAGEPAYRQPAVTGVGTGVLEGVKSFSLGIGHGFAGFFVKPVKGFGDGGLTGAVAGFGEGTADFLLRPLAGTIDLVALSGKGISQSVKHFRRSHASASPRPESPISSSQSEPTGALEVPKLELWKLSPPPAYTESTSPNGASTLGEEEILRRFDALVKYRSR